MTSSEADPVYVNLNSHVEDGQFEKGVIELSREKKFPFACGCKRGLGCPTVVSASYNSEIWLLKH